MRVHLSEILSCMKNSTFHLSHETGPTSCVMTTINLFIAHCVVQKRSSDKYYQLKCSSVKNSHIKNITLCFKNKTDFLIVKWLVYFFNFGNETNFLRHFSQAYNPMDSHMHLVFIADLSYVI